MATKEEILSSIREKYPDYADIPDEQLAPAIAAKYPEYAPSLVPTSRVASDIKANPKMGVVPAPTTAEKAGAASYGALEAIGRLPGEVANIPFEVGKIATLGQSSGLANAIRGSIESGQQTLEPIQNLTPKAFSAVGLEPNSPEAPQIRSPGAAGLGEFIANAATLAGAKPFEKGMSVVEKMFPKVASRIAPATVEQTAMAALDLPKADVARHIPIVTRRVAETVGTVPKTAEEAVNVLNKAEDALYQGRKAINEQAAQEGLVASGDKAIQAAKDKLDSIPNLLPKEKEAILNDLTERYGGDHSPQKGQEFQQRLNHELSSQYANETFDRAAPANEARVAVRDSFANQMDQISKAITGKDETPYSDIGSLIEVRDNLVKQLEKLQGKEAAAKTGIQKAATDIPVTKYHVIRKIEKSALGPFQKTQLEKLDAAIQKIFSEGTQAQPGAALSPEDLQAIRSGQLPVVISGQEPAVVPPPNLEKLIAKQVRESGTGRSDLGSQIEEQLKTYPKSFVKKDPKLARIAAEQELRQSQGILPEGEAALPVEIPETVPVKTYPPEVQARLDEMSAEAKSYRQRVQSSQRTQQEKDRLLKGFGMRQAAEKRQLTGELTGKEASAKAAREAGNYIGKPVQVNVGGELTDAEVIGNPFGRVKVRLKNGREITVDPENISTE